MKNTILILAVLVSLISGLGLLGVFSSPEPDQSWKREVAQSSRDFPPLTQESTKEKLEFLKKSNEQSLKPDEAIISKIWTDSKRLDIGLHSYQLSQTTLASFEELYQKNLGAKVLSRRGIVYYRPNQGSFDRVKSENALLVLKDKNTGMTVLVTGRFILKFQDLQLQEEVLSDYDLEIYYQQARLNIVFTDGQIEEPLFELYQKLKEDERIESVELELLSQPASLR